MVRSSGLWRTVGAQLRRPSGPLAPLAAAAMRISNAGPYRMSLAALAVEPKHDVLELGFGPGEGLRALARAACHGIVWGVDHSEAMVAAAQARNAMAISRGQVRLRQSSFEELPLADASVDRILAVNVAYFWGDGERVLREIDRVLKPGGRLSVYVTDASALRRWKFAGPATHRTFTASELAALLHQSPLEWSAIRVEAVRLALGVPGLVATAVRRASTRSEADRLPPGL